MGKELVGPWQQKCRSATRIVEQALIKHGSGGQSEDPRLPGALNSLDSRRPGQIKALEKLFGFKVGDLREELEAKRKKKEAEERKRKKV